MLEERPFLKVKDTHFRELNCSLWFNRPVKQDRQRAESGQPEGLAACVIGITAPSKPRRLYPHTNELGLWLTSENSVLVPAV